MTAVSSSRRRCASRSSQCSPRSPWPAAPAAGIASDRRRRTTPCSRVRTSADTSARASGSVLRTTACGSGRTARRSRAAAAPLRRVPRRRFPKPRCCRLDRPDRRGGLGSHTRRIGDAGVALAAHVHDWLVMPPSFAPVSAPGVPDILGTDRCSQPSPSYAVPAAPSRPCRAEHLSGFRRVTPYSLEASCEHL